MKKSIKDKVKSKLRNGALIGLATLMTATSTACSLEADKVDNDQEIVIKQDMGIKQYNESPYQRLQAVRKIKLPTYEATYKDEDGVKRKYTFAYEEDVVELCIQMAEVLEDYFISIGAKPWTSDDKKQFWPEDIGYIVAAIAYRESTYRTNIVNDKGCQGITCIKEKALLNSLEQWFTPNIWGDGVEYVGLDADKVDMLNPTTSIEYMYYEIGYYLTHWYKSYDKNRGKKSVWDKLEYSEDLQERLIIATHLFGIGNMEDSIYKCPNQNGEIVPLKDCVYSDYVEDVLAKAQELKLTYGNNYTK